jgi:hypothetical protein
MQPQSEIGLGDTARVVNQLRFLQGMQAHDV